MKTNRILLIAILVVNVLGLGYLATNTSGGISNNIKADVLAALKENDAAQAGGEANYKILQEIYANKKFQKTQNANFKNTLQQLKAVPRKEITEGTLSKEDLTKITKDITAQGKEDAKLLFVEYSDVNCGACKAHHARKTMDKVLEANKDKVKFVMKNFPLGKWTTSQPAAEAIECAKSQGDSDKAYGFINKLFAVNRLTEDGIYATAKEVGLDSDKIKKCVTNGEKKSIIAAQKQEGNSIFDITGTPTIILINTETGKYKNVRKTVDQMNAAIAELK